MYQYATHHQTGTLQSSTEGTLQYTQPKHKSVQQTSEISRLHTVKCVLSQNQKLGKHNCILILANRKTNNWDPINMHFQSCLDCPTKTMLGKEPECLRVYLHRERQARCHREKYFSLINSVCKRVVLSRHLPRSLNGFFKCNSHFLTKLLSLSVVIESKIETKTRKPSSKCQNFTM